MNQIVPERHTAPISDDAFYEVIRGQRVEKPLMSSYARVRILTDADTLQDGIVPGFTLKVEELFQKVS
jgi:hypothetical protein